MKSKHSKLSVFISLVLRHKPEAIGMKLDKNGYLDVNEMIKNINTTGRKIDKEILDEIVSSDEKGRYSYNSDKTKIHANQGHSVKVDVNLTETKPPEFLYHGTSEENAKLIMLEGINKKSRLHVHLTDNKETAEKVGKRKGSPKVLTVKSGEMYEDGFKFHLSKNNVWLIDEVKPEYVKE